MTTALILSALFDISLAAVLLVYARRHYSIHKAMHRNVSTLFDFVDDRERGESYGGNANGGNNDQFEHRGISI
jgi:hypothetical protein